MQVVQDQQQRLHQRRTPEQTGDGLEQVEARRIRLLRANRGGRGRPQTLGEAGDQLSDMGRPRTRPGGKGLLIQVLGEGTDQLAPRPERRCAPTLPAATPHDTGSLPGRVRCKVLGQPGLADPGLAGDQEQPPPAAGRVLQGGQQLRHFPVPAHEGSRSWTRGSIPHLSHRASQPSARHPPRYPPSTRIRLLRPGMCRPACTTVEVAECPTGKNPAATARAGHERRGWSSPGRRRSPRPGARRAGSGGPGWSPRSARPHRDAQSPRRR
jgi:hypothetical protein